MTDPAFGLADDIATAVYAELKRRHWSQRQLAEAMGYSTKHVNNALTARSTTLAMLVRMAAHLDVPITVGHVAKKVSDLSMKKIE